jgi:MtN3 and saliva related transmembrane protein
MIKGWKTRFDDIMVVAGLVSPLATIPQIIKLYGTHSQHASGQSLVTWAVYTGIALLWVIYGMVNCAPAILVGNGLGAAVYAIMVAGILINAGITF